MAYLGIDETQLQILDNEQNRNLVKHKILADYIDKFVPINQDDIHIKMVHTLDVILSSMKLHQLLVLTAKDCDALIMKYYIKKMRECNQKDADIMHKFVSILLSNF